MTLDLNGRIALRSRRDEMIQPTEVLLTGSDREGDDVRLQMNRKYLARASKLGFRELFLYGDRSPAACHDQQPQLRLGVARSRFGDPAVRSGPAHAHRVVAMRQHVAVEMSRVQRVLDGLLVNRPRRAILCRPK